MAEIQNLPWVADSSKALEDQPNINLIEQLELLLAAARDGAIDGMAFAWTNPFGRVAQGWVVGNSQHRLLAAVCYLQHRLTSENLEESARPCSLAPEEPA